MAQPPVTPSFEKAKYAGEAGPLFARFWELIQSFLKTTSTALSRGLTLRENMAAGWVELSIPASPTYPITVANPLPNGAAAYGALVAWVQDAADPNRTCTATSSITDSGGDTATIPAAGVFVEVGNGDGVLVVRNVTGLPTGRAYTLRVAVFAG